VSSLVEFLRSARRELPPSAWARWACVFFTLFALTLLVSIAASQAFLAAAGICFAVHAVRARPRRWDAEVRFPPVTIPLALFSLGTVLAVVFAVHPGPGGFAIRKLALFVILLFGASLVAGSRHLSVLLSGFFLTAALAAVVGIGQFLFQYRAARALHPEGIYVFMISDRITGFMGHWMNFGGQQMLVFALLAAFLLFGPRSGTFSSLFSKRAGAAALALVALALVLNLTRGVWLGCLAAAIYLVGRARPRWLLALPAVALAAFLAAPGLVRERLRLVAHPSSDPSLAIRFEMWRVGLNMIRSHPWTGVGPNNIAPEYTLYLPPGTIPLAGYRDHLHNNLFQLGAERGLPALAAWVWLMGALGWRLLQLAGRLAEWRWLAEGAFAAWLAFVVEGFFEFNFGASPVLMAFLFVVAIPFGAAGAPTGSVKAQGRTKGT
jgi:O-antigen ligase